VKYVCENCGCEIDKSLLLGYKDEPMRGLCNNCRPLILYEFWCQDHPEECEETEAQS
jgi:hypothetical protein